LSRRLQGALAVAVSALIPAALIPAAALAAAPATTAAASAAPYGVVVDRDLRIPMSDGAFLVADVHRPARNGKAVAGRFPVIVSQTPYNKNVPGANMADDSLVEHGYVQVIADVRGTGGSPGTWLAFSPREQRDGKDVVDWAASAKRPWSDGKVGLFGASYGGINQIFTAAQHPTGLKAIFPVVPMGDAYRDVVGSGGQVDVEFVPLWMGLIAGLGILPPSYAGADPQQALKTVLQHLSGVGSFDIPLMLDALTGKAYAFDGPFYQQRSPLNVIDKVKVPTYIVGGEYDLFQRGEPLLYQRLAADHVPVRFTYGPWYHVDAAAPALGLPLPGDPQPPGPSLQDTALAWFDHYLKGAPLAPAKPVTYYEIGSGAWRHAAQWPPAGVHYEKLSLSGSSTPGHPGALTTGTSAGRPDFVKWDPTAGVCSRSTVQWSAGILARFLCDNDNRANDALGVSYDLPVTKPLRLAGTLDAHLSVASPDADGQLTVRLEDVAPDGSSSQLTAGWQVLSLRKLDRSKSVVRDGLVVQPWHPFTKQSIEPMPKGGRTTTVDVEIFPTAAEIEPGHHLRVSIQTADFPHLLPPLPQLGNSIGPGISLYHDAADPSWITLPVQG
jgi:uncharacterized protein